MSLSGGSSGNCGWPHTVDVTEAASFAFLCVMQTTGPVDGNVALVTVQARGALHRAAGTDAAELEQTIENRTIVANVVFALLAHETVHVVGRNLLEELNVFICVKLCHFGSDGWFCTLTRRVSVYLLTRSYHHHHQETKLLT